MARRGNRACGSTTSRHSNTPVPTPGLDAIADSVRAAIDHARENGVRTIYLPRIGAGIGGLDWDDVRATLETVDAEADDVELVVVSLPS